MNRDNKTVRIPHLDIEMSGVKFFKYCLDSGYLLLYSPFFIGIFNLFKISHFTHLSTKFWSNSWKLQFKQICGTQLAATE